MNIGAVAAASGVAAKTIRYYESIGLIGAATRSGNGYRTYSRTDVETLRFIQRARSLGFSLEQVGDLLTLWRNKERTSADVKAIALSHVEEIDRKIKEMHEMRATLMHLVHQCHGDERPDCPILESLSEPCH